jgi:hypothetical protein
MLAQVLGSPRENLYIYINIKANKTLYKANLYMYHSGFTTHHTLIIRTIITSHSQQYVMWIINNRFKIMIIIDISSQFIYLLYVTKMIIHIFVIKTLLHCKKNATSWNDTAVLAERFWSERLTSWHTEFSLKVWISVFSYCWPLRWNHNYYLREKWVTCRN